VVIEGTIPGGFQAASDVLARDGYLYFRGTDDAVWRVNATCPSESTNYGGPRVVAAQSNVFPADDGYLYFRGTCQRGDLPPDRGRRGIQRRDDAVCRVRASGPDASSAQPPAPPPH
jgi:hypothetical protein